MPVRPSVVAVKVLRRRTMTGALSGADDQPARPGPPGARRCSAGGVQLAAAIAAGAVCPGTFGLGTWDGSQAMPDSRTEIDVPIFAPSVREQAREKVAALEMRAPTMHVVKSFGMDESLGATRGSDLFGNVKKAPDDRHDVDRRSPAGLGDGRRATSSDRRRRGPPNTGKVVVEQMARCRGPGRGRPGRRTRPAGRHGDAAPQPSGRREPRHPSDAPGRATCSSPRPS